eukprot:m.15793 g.15793  ORF g.15793 m.15793 type:complete len:582 (-) comp8782_c0_seq1:49-1794(-)
MGKLSGAERRTAVGLLALVGCGALVLQFRTAFTPPAGLHCPPGYKQRLELADGIVKHLRLELADAKAAATATATAHRDRASTADASAAEGLAETQQKMEGLTAELAKTKKQLDEVTAQLAAAHASTTAEATSSSVGASSSLETRTLYEKVYPMGEGDSIPFVGSVLAYEGWKAGGVQQAVLLGESAAIAAGDPSSCEYIDVVFQHPNRGRCTLVVDQVNHWHNNEDGRKGTGWEGEGFAMATAMSFTMNTTAHTPLRERVPREKWLEWIQKNRDTYLLPFLTNKDSIVAAAKGLIGVGRKDAAGGSEPLLVMCANHGHFALMLNFFCSLRAAGIETPKHFIVTTSVETEQMLTGMGLTAFYHKGLGEFPTKASDGYGDETFVRMMMLKQFAVYVALLCRYDVLFQDVDLTWSRNPIPTLRAESEFFHGQFMDDGARNFLNAPYMANSGFFYLRSDFLSFKFWDAVTMMMLVGPNQRIVARMLEVYTARYGLKVRTLPWQQYTNGKHLLTNRKRKRVEEMLAAADVLHFCWTLNIDDKYNKMKVHDAVHISRECYFNVTMCHATAASGPNWRDHICIEPKST